MLFRCCFLIVGIVNNYCLCLQVTIKQATGLPLSLSNFVFCQYSFWNYPDSIAVPPVVNPEYPVPCSSGRDSMTFKFDHTHDFDIPLTEEFLEHCSGKYVFTIYIVKQYSILIAI